MDYNIAARDDIENGASTNPDRTQRELELGGGRHGSHRNYEPCLTYLALSVLARNYLVAGPPVMFNTMLVSNKPVTEDPKRNYDQPDEDLQNRTAKRTIRHVLENNAFGRRLVVVTGSTVRKILTDMSNAAANAAANAASQEQYQLDMLVPADYTALGTAKSRCLSENGGHTEGKYGLGVLNLGGDDIAVVILKSAGTALKGPNARDSLKFVGVMHELGNAVRTAASKPTLAIEGGLLEGLALFRASKENVAKINHLLQMTEQEGFQSSFVKGGAHMNVCICNIISSCIVTTLHARRHRVGKDAERIHWLGRRRPSWSEAS